MTLEVEDCHNFFAEGILVHNCIIDDPHKNWEEAMSPVTRERVIEWFNSTLYTRLEPHASICLIQTRWHGRDLSGYLLNEHSDPWQLIKYPALSEGEGDILGRAEGDALCPPRFPIERLNEIKKVVGSHIFAGLYQQRPAPIMGGIVKKDWLRYWTELPANIRTNGSSLGISRSRRRARLMPSARSGVGRKPIIIWWTRYVARWISSSN